MKAGPAFVLAASLAFSLPGTAPCQSVRAIVDIGSPKAYAFNEARISSHNGVSGLARLYGTGVDGDRALLFESRTGWDDEIVATWYYGPALVSLSFEGFDGDGIAIESTARLKVPVSGTVFAAASRLSRLGFPFRQFPFGEPRPSVALSQLVAAGGNADPEAYARIALDKLFMPGRRAAPLAIMAGWVGLVIVSAQWLVATGYRRKRIALAVCAVAAFSGFAYLLGSGPAELYRVGLPTASQGAVVPAYEAPMSIADHGGWRALSWGGETELSFIAVRSPLAAAVPVSAFAGFGMIRFARTPLVVTAPDGTAMLAPSSLAMAWAFHE